MLGNIYILPIPNDINRHYFVISSKNDDCYLLVSFSSVKYREDGSEKYYDNSCVFDLQDNIKDIKENLIINKKSYIRFDKYIETKNIYNLQKYYIGKLKLDLLKRITENVRSSKDITKYILDKYF